MQLVYHTVARAEISKITGYYAEIDLRLAEDFGAILNAAIEDIQLQPLRYRIVHNDVRKCSLKRFPYGLFFRLKGKTIRILTVKHHRRDPDYGRDRS